MIAGIDLALGMICLIPRNDPFYIQFMMPIYLWIGAGLFVLWSTTYYTLSNGVLEKHVLFLSWKRFSVEEIREVRPHRKNGEWGYGTVLEVWTKSGDKVIMQPNHPMEFLALLRQEAPQAEFML